MPTKVATAPSRPKVKLTKLFIDNKWMDPVDGGEFETYNPATGEVIAKVAAAGAADVDKAVKAARRALETAPWSTMDAADRGRLLFKLADQWQLLAARRTPSRWRGSFKPATSIKMRKLSIRAGWSALPASTFTVRPSVLSLRALRYWTA